jgi:hypothetical protein
VPVAPSDETPQQRRVDLAPPRWCAVALDTWGSADRCKAASRFGGCLMRKANDLIISFQDEPLVGGEEPVDARGNLSHGRDVDLADRRVENGR